MEVKNLNEAPVKQEIIDRINKLTPESRAKWGKMTVGQMLAHLQMPMGIALGTKTIPRSFLGRLLGGLFKKQLYNDKPFKRNLPTAPSFKMTTAREFEEEKQKVIEVIRKFNEENLIDIPHPVFGKMTKEQWGLSNWKHLDHHLQQFGV